MRIAPALAAITACLTVSACGSAGPGHDVVAESSTVRTDGEPSPVPTTTARSTPDPSRSVTTWSPLSASTIAFLMKQGIRVVSADPEVEHPQKSAAAVAGPPSSLPEHELTVWEVGSRG